MPAYETYHEKITNIYLDEPLRKVKDYSDYIDLINKQLPNKYAIHEGEYDNYV